MKPSRAAGFLAIILTATAFSQVVPANPRKFKTRPIGSGVSGGVDVLPTEPTKPKARYITHIVLYEERFWTSAEGKPLQGKLIAFEDLVAEAPAGATQPVMPEPPARPTVIRDGKIRLLVNQKPVELALTRLSEADKEFVAGIAAALTRKAAKPAAP